MSRRRRRGFIDVSRAHGRHTVRSYTDPTVAEQIQKLKVERDSRLGRLAVKHTQEIRELAERQQRERRSVWDLFDQAKNKLLEKTRTERAA